MRSGACAVQQTLTAEAASILKHSLSLARRRGHAQVTPLHVAATLLSSRASSLRRACLKSQPHQASHPLQCRALELCFNVSLNRLPTIPGPLLHGQPSLSNALIAALKRAQAHQRRGCIEQQQQQPLLTIKVELEQLIISILDDPSVSRVMREAGFSSTAVKNNLEDTSTPSVFQCYSSSGGGVFSSPCSPSPTETQRPEIINPSHFWQTHFLTYTPEHNPALFAPQRRSITGNPIFDSASFKEDIKLVLDIFLKKKKKKNTVIVGDSVSITEGHVAELMGRLERGDVPEELKSVRLIKFQFAPVSLRFMKREEVEMNLSELKRKVDSLVSGGGGAIIYAGDLKWTVDATFSDKEGGCFPDGEVSGNYSPVYHLVAEIGRLFSDYGSSNAKVWLMATASYQTYMRCQIRQPPLEVQWALQAVPVPSGGLGLSLHSSSVHDSRMNISQNPSHHMLETKPFSGKEEQDKLTCCVECASNYEKEAQLFKPDQQKLLPSWLQSHGSEAQLKDELVQLRRKWNRLCHCLHQSRHSQNHLKPTLYSNQSSTGKSYPYNTSSYTWRSSQNSDFPDSSSISFSDSANKPNPNSSNLVPQFKRQQSCTIEFNFSNGIHKHEATEASLGSLKSMEGKELKITLALGNSLFGNSGQLEEKKTERTIGRAHISKLLQESVPWQSETTPSIAEALFDSKAAKQNTWLLIQGNDSLGKRRLAVAIAESVLGSADLLFTLNMRKKEAMANPCSMLAKALKTHEKLVILLEEVDFADTQFKKFLADGFVTGKFGEPSSKDEILGQTIFILTKNGSTSYEENNQDTVIRLMLQVSETKPNSETTLLNQKRKVEWDLLTKTKNARIEENKVLVGEYENCKKSHSRQSSFNTLDLNIRADEEDESEDKPGESSPNSSDLTRETSVYPMNPNAFLESIENRFIFDQSPARDREMTEFFTSKFKGSFEEICGKQNLVNFSVEERVLEEVLVGSGFFADNLFEKWLKDIFQTSFQTVNFGGKEGIVFRLCLDSKGKGDSIVDSGYMGSCLPKKIQVNFMD
ncbi:protein SMAX1-LIKE 4-like [Quillaja saponaria]|uniref:Protein SMAX1-LIKE 4-like n=1 Tax=Quillaja saponaria TaxID=32244 RepID=A0AAD7LCY6_QUISA|nr:protein SMAX1-LIKE 4-like [Quillaja saponaria]